MSVRRRQGEGYLPECLNTTMKHGGGGIMVCCSFAKNGVGRLHKVTGKINADHYKNILKYCVLPSMQLGRPFFNKITLPVTLQTL